MLFKLHSAASLLVAFISCVNLASAQNHYAITGVKTGINTATGYVPPRRRIDDLMGDVPQWSLYVQAMNKLMLVPESNLTSWFQISGIHGRPYTAWDGYPYASKYGSVPPQTGYCTHSSPFFPTWHRPYLALLEQVLAIFAQQIAKDYNSSIYQKAADALRLPYWDWAAVPQQFPGVFTWPTVRIMTSSGVPKNVTNPLLQYTYQSHPESQYFPSNLGGLDGYLASQRTTVRYGNNAGQSNNAAVSPQILAYGPGMTSTVWNTFARSKDYLTMATMASGGSSFEDPHGLVHVLVGGSQGTMTPISFSGFDPAFYLHHCNVDRLVAMWQAIYPNAWFTPTTDNSGSWSIYPGTAVTGNTPLAPWTTGDKKTPWTSNTARYTETLGYSYPETQKYLFSTPAKYAANVTAAVNKLYNADGSRGTIIPGARVISYREWSVNIAVPNSALGESFSVTVSVAGTSIGKLTVMALPVLAPGTGATANGRYTLTGDLGGNNPEDVASVVAYLKANLTYSVVKSSSGVVVPIDQVKGLSVLVEDVIVTPAQDDTQFPTYGTETMHPEVTA